MTKKLLALSLLTGLAALGCGSDSSSSFYGGSQDRSRALQNALDGRQIVVKAPTSLGDVTGADGVTVRAATNQLIVTLDQEITDEQLEVLEELLVQTGATLVGEIPETLQVELEFPPSSDLAALERLFLAADGVDDVAFNEIIGPDAPVAPTPATFAGDYWVDQINAPQGWGLLSSSNPYPLVAIADDGYRASLGVFERSRLQAQVDSVGTPISDPTEDDDGEHGSFVLTFALGNGGSTSTVPTVGVNWGSRALSVQVMGRDSQGFSFNAHAAMAYALNNGAKVINCSFGPRVVNPKSEADFYTVRSAWRAPFTAALELAAERDAVICFSAGNDGQGSNGFTAKRDDNFLPANTGEKVGPWSTHACIVGASNASLAMAGFSREGRVVHLAAPGEDIGFARPQGNSPVGSGTSYAAPLATGAISALLNVKPDLMTCEARQLTLDTLTRNLTSVAGQVGLLNFGAAAETAAALPARDSGAAIVRRLNAGEAQSVSVSLQNPSASPQTLSLAAVGDAYGFTTVAPASYLAVPAGETRTFQVTLARDNQVSGRDLTFPYMLWGRSGTSIVRRLPVTITVNAQ